MKKGILANIFLIVGVIAYNYLFWGEKMGLNVLIFTVLLLVGLFTLYPESRQSNMAKITALGTLVTASLIVYNNSLYSKVMYFISMFATVGFVQRHALRFFWYGLSVFALNFMELPKRFGQEIGRLTQHIQGFHKVVRFGKLAILPSIVVVVFWLIYSVANPNFADLSNRFFLSLNDFLFSWIYHISVERFLFLFSGFVIMGLVIYKHSGDLLEKLEATKRFKLVRKLAKTRQAVLATEVSGQAKAEIENLHGNTQNYKPKEKNPIRLKNEYRTALMLFWALNALLLVVNLTDIPYLFEDFSSKAAWELKQYVHQGTYLLIVAIFFAMALILFYFRKNLNFYPRNAWLKTAAYVWIFQNILLAVSVGIRNYNYVAFDGLAYKRIGVFIFLILVAVGLFTVFLKVRDKKTGYYLFFTNSWAAYLVLVAFAFVNWDVWITEYNLKHFPKEEKLSFLIREVSDKNLWVLEENGIDEYSIDDGYLATYLKDKRINFMNEQLEYSWLSWNYVDSFNEQYLYGN